MKRTTFFNTEERMVVSAILFVIAYTYIMLVWPHIPLPERLRFPIEYLAVFLWVLSGGFTALLPLALTAWIMEAPRP